MIWSALFTVGNFLYGRTGLRAFPARHFPGQRDRDSRDSTNLEVTMDDQCTASRRDLLRLAGLASLGAGLARATPGRRPAGKAWPDALRGRAKVRLGFIGIGGRGNSLIDEFTAIPDVEILALCDVVPEKTERRKRGWSKPASPRPRSTRRRPRLRKAGGARRSRPGDHRDAVDLARAHGAGRHETGQTRRPWKFPPRAPSTIAGTWSIPPRPPAGIAFSSKTAATATTR